MFSLLNAYPSVLGLYFAQIFRRISYAFGPFEGDVDCRWPLYFPSFGAELDHSLLLWSFIGVDSLQFLECGAVKY